MLLPDPLPGDTLAAKWAAFRAIIVTTAKNPIHADELEQVRRTFYAGAASMMGLLTELAGPDDEPSEIGAARFEAVAHEIHAFTRELEAHAHAIRTGRSPAGRYGRTGHG